jgi:hypothetical protein
VMDIGGAPWIMAAWVTHSAKGGCFLRSEPAYILPASLSDAVSLHVAVVRRNSQEAI